MSNHEDKKHGKVTLDIEVKDLLNIVSSSKAPPFSGGAQMQHSIEGEELRKAWFKHMLISMEKLGDAIQDIRTNDIVRLRQELKEDLKRLEDRIIKNEDALSLYKKDTIKPLSALVSDLKDKITTLLAKLGMLSIIAGIVGSGLATVGWYILKTYVFKASTGGP